jgi:hypothetical protein
MCNENIEKMKSEKGKLYDWLITNGDVPIQYALSKELSLRDEFLKNDEVYYWLQRLKQRSDANDFSKIHGSHDYRMENILGKLWLLGFDRNIPAFYNSLQFILKFLQQHIKSQNRGSGFGAIYSNLDYELILAAYMPFFGYYDDDAVQYIARKRINLLHAFVESKNFNIYIDSAGLKSVPKAWKEYILNPDLYADGNVRLPFVHDVIFFAGIYNHIDKDMQQKIDNIINWMCSDTYTNMWKRKAIFYAEGGQYTAKSIGVGAYPPNINSDDNRLLFKTFLWSHFSVFRATEQYRRIMEYLKQYSYDTMLYKFPRNLITEKTDVYLTAGGHMNLGENKKSLKYYQLISSYWMYRIYENENN